MTDRSTHQEYVVEASRGHWDGWREMGRYTDLTEAKEHLSRLHGKREEARIVTERDGYVDEVVNW